MDVRTYMNFISGEWIPSCTGKTFTMINPANQQIIAHAQKSNEEDMHKAIDAAHQAFNCSSWRSNSALRSEVLFKFAELLTQRKEELAKLYTQNNGKTINEARGEISGSIDSIKYTAGLARNVFGRSIEPAPKSLSMMIREPVGVVGIISPWNWPVQLMIREMVPALAAGNAIILKPATLTAAVSMEVIKILSKVSELPKGIVNAVSGPGQSIGEVLANSNQVNMISFTGSTDVGLKIAELSAKTMKKVTLELGGKSPNIIFEDADLDKAIPAAIKAVFLTSGQVCMAGTRLVVQNTIFDKVVKRIKDETENLKVANGMIEDSQMGPLVSKSQLETVMEYIQLGKKKGKLITGGSRMMGKDYEKGFFVQPTVFTDLDNHSRLVQEEIFGPVLVIQKFNSESEAVEIANGTSYGLASAVWTQNINRAIRVSKAMQAGTVWVNSYFKLYNQTEFGGYKASGIGRTRGIDGINEFTQMKHINFDVE